MQPPNLPAARTAVLLVFFIHGAVFSTWVSRIPEVQSGLGLSTGDFGLALMGIAAGCLISLPAAGWLIVRFGSKPVTAASSVWFCLALIAPAWAASATALSLALCLLGLSAGAMDVAMNAQGAVVERLAHKPLMSGFHAMFSMGGMAGAGAGGLIAKSGLPVATHFLVSALLCLAAILFATHGLLPAHADPAPSKRAFHLTPAIAGMGVLAFCFFLSEGAVADWSAIYLSRTLGSGPAQAAAGYAAFSLAMAAGRLSGDRLGSRFGPAPLVRYGSLIAALGMSVALLAANPAWALAGFTLVGFGCSIIVPVTFAAAANSGGGGALAAVATMGYLGLFAGPPAVGLAAEAIPLRWALFLVVLLMLSGLTLASLVQVADSATHAPRQPAGSG